MSRVTENKIILIMRRTRLDELMIRFNTLKQAQFYIEHLGADFSDYLKEDETYKQVLVKAENLLNNFGRVQKLERSFLPNFMFAQQDTVVVLGQDGLVANTLKYLNGQLVIGVNPDPQRWEGVLLPFKINELTKVIPETFAHRCSVKEITMAKVTLNNGQILYGVNDLFIGPKSHTSARYLIRIGNEEAQHLSSGIVVSTGLGSTGWLKSLIVGAMSITRAWVKEPISWVEESTLLEFILFKADGWSFPWDADYLYFTVREPFPSTTSSTKLVFGKITTHEPMVLVSQMPENGVIFSDGIENDFLEFNAGTRAIIEVAEKRGRLVV